MNLIKSDTQSKISGVSFASPPGTRRLTINAHERINFTPEEVKKHATALGMLETILNSVQFRDRLFALKQLKLLNGLSRESLYYIIMSGKETNEPEVDYEMDIYVTMYYSGGKVVGYTNPSTVKTWLNRKFFTWYEFAEIAGNAFHEWLHKLGFDHTSATDYSSIPYALGYLVEAMIKELVAGAKFDMIDGLNPNLPEIVQPTPATKPATIVVCKRSWKYLWLKKVCYIQAKN